MKHQKQIEILIIIISFLLLNCNRNIKPVLNDKLYNVKIKIVKSDSEIINNQLINHKINFRDEYENNSHHLWMHSYNQVDHYFMNSDLEIQFEKIGRRKEEKNLFKSDIIHYFICTNNEVYDKCIYIIWIIHIPIPELYKSYLGNFIDTIYSNINNKELKKIFPKFNGVCIHNKVNEIIIDYRYFKNKDDFKFFYAIKFIGFDNDYIYIPEINKIKE